MTEEAILGSGVLRSVGIPGFRNQTVSIHPGKMINTQKKQVGGFPSPDATFEGRPAVDRRSTFKSSIEIEA